MNFQEMLKQAQAEVQQQQSGDDVVHPYTQLKHDTIRFTAKNPSEVLRILPPASPDQFFGVETREIWLNTRNKGGKDIQLKLVMSKDATPETSKAMAQIVEWQQQGRVPAKYPTISKRFYVNAVRLINQGGQMVHETDQQGNLIVRMVELPYTVYKTLVTKLTDPMLRPQGSDEFGFIGENNAFPIKIERTQSGKEIKYDVNVYGHLPLGALPQGWRDQLEDLEYQTSPTEEYNAEFMQYFFDVVNGVEGQNNGGANANQAPVAQTPPPSQPKFNPAPVQQQPEVHTTFNQDEVPSVPNVGVPVENTTPQQPQVQQPQVQQPAPQTGAPAEGAGMNVDDLLSQMRQQMGN